ncbi:MAG: SemiSWEET transporter [Kordiimonadaceae bacterium]|nr:SemiSWEET transporter [Kordiimonadaceae bacterium]
MSGSIPLEYVGYAAATFTTYAFVPQAVKVWREDDTRAISLGMYSMMVTGIALWLAYGLIINSYPLIISNTITFAIALTILYKKISHVRRGES